MLAVLAVGAEKISIDSQAVRNPELITHGAREFGSQAIALSMQVMRVPTSEPIPSGYEIAIDEARTYTGLDAVEWAVRGADLGPGEICINSIDQATIALRDATRVTHLYERGLSIIEVVERRGYLYSTVRK